MARYHWYALILRKKRKLRPRKTWSNFRGFPIKSRMLDWQSKRRFERSKVSKNKKEKNMKKKKRKENKEIRDMHIYSHIYFYTCTFNICTNIDGQYCNNETTTWFTYDTPSRSSIFLQHSSPRDYTRTLILTIRIFSLLSRFVFWKWQMPRMTKILIQFDCSDNIG